MASFAEALRAIGSLKGDGIVEDYAVAGPVEGVPTQFLPSPSALADEAILSAATRDYEGVAVRVVRPEHLVALYLEPAARTAKRQARAAMLLESPELNRQLLDEILERHGLQL